MVRFFGAREPAVCRKSVLSDHLGDVLKVTYTILAVGREPYSLVHRILWRGSRQDSHGLPVIEIRVRDLVRCSSRSCQRDDWFPFLIGDARLDKGPGPSTHNNRRVS